MTARRTVSGVLALSVAQAVLRTSSKAGSARPGAPRRLVRVSSSLSISVAASC